MLLYKCVFIIIIIIIIIIERKIQHFHQSNQGSSESLFEKILRVSGSLK